MDDMLHGLSLLGPRIEQMSAHIEKLSNEVADQRTLLAQKAEHTEMTQLRHQLNSLGHGMAQKIDQLDRDTQEFMESTAQKMNHLGDQVEEKASSLRLEQLEDRIAKALLSSERKAEASALRRLEEQVLELGGYVETKAELEQLEAAEAALKALEEATGKLAATTDLEMVRQQIKELQNSKAESALLDQLVSKERTLTTSLSEKADFVELEQLKIQVHALSGATAQQRETATQELETVQSKLQALGTALGQCAGLEEFRESVKEITTDLVKKADATKLDVLMSQVEILSDVLAPKLRRANPPRPTAKTRKKSEATQPAGESA